MTAIRTIVILFGLAFVTGCSVNPVTGENELSLVSTNQEIAMGRQQYAPAQQSQGGQYTLDPALQDYVASVGQRLAAVSDAPALPYEFVVLNNSVPNAWALPGGKIAINRGLLTELQDEAELAAVLGHEVVHAAARHSASQMSRGMLVNLTTQLATIAAASQGYGEVGSMASQLGGAAFMAKYGRDDELESDKYGMRYMAKAGYDPQAAVRLQETFVRLSNNKQSDLISGLFASHPPSQERVDANRERAAHLPAGENYRQRYLKNTKQLRKDAPAYQAQKNALAALQEKDARTAFKYLDTAIKLQPAEAQFWEMRGHAWEMLENPGNAEKAYGTAIKKNPTLFSPWLYRGMTRYRQDKLQGAFNDLAKSREFLPTTVSAYYLGDISLRQGHRPEGVAYLQQAMQGSNKEIASAAFNKLARLELPEAPYKYIASKAFLGSDGYLHIALRNNTDFPVKNVQVQLAEITSSQTVGATRTFKQRYSLKARQQIEIKTRIGPFRDPAQAPRFQARVSKAKPADLN